MKQHTTTKRISTRTRMRPAVWCFSHAAAATSAEAAHPRAPPPPQAMPLCKAQLMQQCVESLQACQHVVGDIAAATCCGMHHGRQRGTAALHATIHRTFLTVVLHSVERVATPPQGKTTPHTQLKCKNKCTSCYQVHSMCTEAAHRHTTTPKHVKTNAAPRCMDCQELLLLSLCPISEQSCRVSPDMRMIACLTLSFQALLAHLVRCPAMSSASFYAYLQSSATQICPWQSLLMQHTPGTLVARPTD